MNESICQDLASLLASTEDMLTCPDPGLEAWQDYTVRRNQVFQRLQDLPIFTEDRIANSVALQQLITSVLEKDQALVLKIGQQLSNISQQMVELADRRRVFNAYTQDARSLRLSHHRTA